MTTKTCPRCLDFSMPVLAAPPGVDYDYVEKPEWYNKFKPQVRQAAKGGWVARTDAGSLTRWSTRTGRYEVVFRWKWTAKRAARRHAKQLWREAQRAEGKWVPA